MVERLRLFLQVRRSWAREATESPIEILTVLRRAMPGGAVVPATGTATTADKDVDVSGVTPEVWGRPVDRVVIHARRASDRGADFD